MPMMPELEKVVFFGSTLPWKVSGNTYIFGRFSWKAKKYIYRRIPKEA